ncbi:Trafficking protein particle complex subunit 11 [Portunus trituberculatus]|uniref:Trafficking protein particle complex subunit 11 n=1 Tax=Portunus trituberculatus TaxID=210409 RepID=A0A5B7J9W0_PORTR|nr:Trafficking protein particle complex subunit 11 [Portunus trituberculatus]
MEDDFDPYGLPPEVTTQPHALIGMLGLDISNKTTHKAVWEAFALNRRTDRTPLHFCHLNNDFQMPPMKQKWYPYHHPSPSLV